MYYVYAAAAAALVDQIDRALCAPEGSAVRRIVTSALDETVLRLGGRPRSSLTWLPAHIESSLREDNIMEMYLLARIRSNRHTLATGATAHTPHTL